MADTIQSDNRLQSEAYEKPSIEIIEIEIGEGILAGPSVVPLDPQPW